MTDTTLMNQPSPIRQFRDNCGMTLEAFASLVGVNKSAVSKWENGVAPSMASARKIEQVTRIPKETLRPDIWATEAAA